jgi:hypothetical protein
MNATGFETSFRVRSRQEPVIDQLTFDCEGNVRTPVVGIHDPVERHRQSSVLDINARKDRVNSQRIPGVGTQAFPLFVESLAFARRRERALVERVCTYPTSTFK